MGFSPSHPIPPVIRRREPNDPAAVGANSLLIKFSNNGSVTAGVGRRRGSQARGDASNYGFLEPEWPGNMPPNGYWGHNSIRKRVELISVLGLGNLWTLCMITPSHVTSTHHRPPHNPILHQRQPYTHPNLPPTLHSESLCLLA